MTDTITLLQFKSPWQGRSGFARYNQNTVTGELTPARKAKTKKLLRKGQKNTDGLILFPTWPTRKGLVVTADETGLQLTQVVRGRPDQSSAPISTADPAFRSEIAERLLYRSFTFSDGTTEMNFSDLSARLVGAQRTAYEVFPTPDFSPFARLIGIINNPDAHAKLVSDLNAGRFDYPRWGETKARSWRNGRSAALKG
ncbi:hypothetical protein GCM10009069_06380 [Algimonas arctica]|uniref:Uncharacterized protein n=1 Tax=Algimonas arctica TaxID=1479486 RepID=A0A8J3G1D6_9PROT|nr:hypothetical protein [Algimonas arctica]GHA85896.1 hypothetical protein GCM10009069_06380 [Algimonas arctica]